MHPDTPSIHQLGNAIDTDEHTRNDALLREHGWVRTVYRGGILVALAVGAVFAYLRQRSRLVAALFDFPRRVAT